MTDWRVLESQNNENLAEVTEHILVEEITKLTTTDYQYSTGMSAK